MKKTIFINPVLLVPIIIGIIFFIGTLSYADSIVYDTLGDGLGTYAINYSGHELGDEITLAGTDRIITEFTFGYYMLASSQLNSSGSFDAQINFYANDGSNGSPGSLLYSSDFTLPDIVMEQRTYTLGIPNIQVPVRFTWTINFDGAIKAQNNMPAVGSSDNYVWYKNVTWTKFDTTISGGNNFEAKINAIAPEPISSILFVTGGTLLAGRRLLRRKA